MNTKDVFVQKLFKCQTVDEAMQGAQKISAPMGI